MKEEASTTDESMNDESYQKPKKASDLASPKMQAMYQAQLRKHSLMPMYSRSGKNTQNQHYEFMQAAAVERYNNLDDSQKIKPKVSS